MKSCPFCTQELPDTAMMCKRCKNALPTRGVSTSSKSTKTQVVEKVEASSGPPSEPYPEVAGFPPLPLPPAQSRAGTLRPGMSKGKVASVVVSIAGVIGFLGWMATRAPEAGRDDPRVAQVKAGLARIQEVTTNPTLCTSPVDVVEAWQRIQQVKPADSEYAAARTAATQLEGCRQKVFAQMKTDSVSLRERERPRGVEQAQARWAEMGINVSVSVSGAKQDEVRVLSPNMSPALVERLTDHLSVRTGTVMEILDKAFFQTIVFTNGKREWRYPLPNREITPVGDTTILDRMGLGKPFVLN